MIRILGAILVILATSYAGYEYSRNLQKRIHQLKGLKKIFVDLYSDVEYGACTLKESFSRIAKKQESLYQCFLDRVCMGMENECSNGMPFGVIFSEAIQQELNKSCLLDMDKDQLLRLGKQLGNQQRVGQLRIIQLYLQELDQQIQELEKCKKDKQKIGQVLGISSGVLIVILLL